MQYSVLDLFAGIESVSSGFRQVLLQSGVARLDAEPQQHPEVPVVGLRVFAAGVNSAVITTAAEGYVLHCR